MPKLKVLSGAEVVRIFAIFGFRVASQRGSHVKLRRIQAGGGQQTLDHTQPQRTRPRNSRGNLPPGVALRRGKRTPAPFLRGVGRLRVPGACSFPADFLGEAGPVRVSEWEVFKMKIRFLAGAPS